MTNINNYYSYYQLYSKTSNNQVSTANITFQAAKILENMTG